MGEVLDVICHCAVTEVTVKDVLLRNVMKGIDKAIQGSMPGALRDEAIVARIGRMKAAQTEDDWKALYAET